MRSIWSGSLNFGLISIPVNMFSGTEEHSINFDMLHKTDLSPIRFARICKADGQEVPYKDIVKGYEYQKGEYVVIEEEDFKSINIEKSETIEIVNFTDEFEIDSMYFEKPYFLEPAKGGNKSYALLREVLKRSKKVGVVKFIFRNREHLGVLKPEGEAIVLEQMRFANEVRTFEELKLPSSDLISKKELDMAMKLIDQLSEHFEIEAFVDSYTEDLKRIIEDKVKGITPRKKGAAASKMSSKVQDIMELLKASLNEESTTSKNAKGTKKRKPPAARPSPQKKKHA